MGMREHRIVGSLTAMLISAVFTDIHANSVWPRPRIVPLPRSVASVSKPRIDLSGTWKFSENPPDSCWLNNVDPSSWAEIEVPGELRMQGIEVVSDKQYFYKKSISIPTDYAGKKIFLRFCGALNMARVWVNGTFIRSHYGGFTKWDCDITDQVTAGSDAWVTVGITDTSNDLSVMSFYEKIGPVAGLTRGIELYALPPDHLTRVHGRTTFDTTTYQRAYLRIDLGAERSDLAGTVIVTLALEDPSGRSVSLSPSAIAIVPTSVDTTLTYTIDNPITWDAEHPRLYSLSATVSRDGSMVERISSHIGMRDIRILKNRVLVNNREIKLRGANRRDIHAIRGISTTPAIDRQDVVLFRDANMNYLRTAHYPPSDALLDACDSLGMYVESETGVCFSGFQGIPNTSSDSSFTDWYMNQFAEMLESELSRPSVIIWSLGNESEWGTNFEMELAYANEEDPDRLTKMSWNNPAADLSSKHYPNIGTYNSNSFPRIYDEFGLVPTYKDGNLIRFLSRDPILTEYWGESVYLFWEGMFRGVGCTGGGIWAAIDELFLTPNGGSESKAIWGFIDSWRRPKPQYHLVRKAFSPIRIEDEPAANPGAGNQLSIPIKNWFDHTDFSELDIRWKYEDDSGSITGMSLAPHDSGALWIPAQAWRDGEELRLQFYRSGGLLVDQYFLPITAIGAPQFAAPRGPAPTVADGAAECTISAADFSVTFDKATAQITEAQYKGQPFLRGGPLINLAEADPGAFSVAGFNCSVVGQEAVVSIEGTHGTVGARYECAFDGTGLMRVAYNFTGIDQSSVYEVGVTFTADSAFDRLYWKRDGQWSWYPDDHIARTEGVALKVRPGPKGVYREKPSWPWSQDMVDYFLFGENDVGGRGTNDFYSTKNDVLFASLMLSDARTQLRVEPGTRTSVRAHINDNRSIALHVNTITSYPNLGWGNVNPRFVAPDTVAGEFALRMTDDTTGIALALSPTSAATTCRRQRALLPVRNGVMFGKGASATARITLFDLRGRRLKSVLRSDLGGMLRLNSVAQGVYLVQCREKALSEEAKTFVAE